MLAERADALQSTVMVDRTDGLVADGTDAAFVGVVVRDASGRVLPGVAVELLVDGSGHTVEGDAQTDAEGVARLRVTSRVAATKRLTVLAEGVELSEQTVRFVAGPGARLAFEVPPGPVEAGKPLSPAVQVRVEDANGNLAASEAVVSLVMEEGPEGAELDGDTTVAAVAGRATFADLRVARAGQYRLAAEADGLSRAVGPEFEVKAGAPARLAFRSQPSELVAGEAFGVTVSLEDALGNRVSDATDAVRLSIVDGPAGADLGGILEAAAVDGVATFEGLVLQRAGEDFVLAASAPGFQGAASAAIAVVPAAPDISTSLVTVSPAVLVADGAEAAVVQVVVRDSFGNGVPQVAVTLEVSGEGHTLAETAGTTNADGRFATSLASTRAEAKTVTASFDGGSVDTTVTFIAGAPDTVRSTLVANRAAAEAADPEGILLTLHLRDAHDNPVGGQPVTLTATGTENTFSQASGEADAEGWFTSRLLSTRAELKTVTATAGAASVSAEVTFTPAAPSAAHSTLVASSPSAEAGASTTITLTVRDAHGNPVPDQETTFSATGTGNELTPITASTDPGGVVTAAFRSSLAELKTVTASFGGEILEVALEVTPGAAAADQSTLVATPDLVAPGESVSLGVVVRDAYGNLVADAPITFAASGTDNVFTPDPPDVVSSASGEASVSLSSSTLEDKTVIATVAGAVTLTTTAAFGYDFTSHTFSHCGRTGPSGPSLTQCQQAYGEEGFWMDSSRYGVTDGIQEWVVPLTGIYRIEVAGAQGGSGSSGMFAGGAGATASGDFALTAGDRLHLLVGQQGVNGTNGGGGGGTFVWTAGDDPTLLLAAGGGGGGGGNSVGLPGQEGTAGTTPNNADIAGGVDGQPGEASPPGPNGATGGSGAMIGGSGAGWAGNGLPEDSVVAHVCNSTYRRSYRPLEGGGGGRPSGANGANGGFGGGGSGNGSCATSSGGGGGGYSGGASSSCFASTGGTQIGTGATGCDRGGGGGGSYNQGANPVNSTGSRTGHGFVTIEKL